MRRKLIGILVLAALLAGACGGGDGNGDGAATESRDTGGDTDTGDSGDGDEAGSDDEFLSRLEQAQQATYKAEYELTDSSGATSTIIIAQDPPKSRFEIRDGSSITTVIDDGEDTYTCTDSGGEEQCFKAEGGGGASFGAGLAAAFSPASVVQAYQAARPFMGDRFEIDTSTETIAGAEADCVTLTDKSAGQTSTYCVTEDGILARVENPDGSVMELSQFSTTVGPEVFQPTGEVVDPESFGR